MKEPKAIDKVQNNAPSEARTPVNCARRLKRFFGTDTEICQACDGTVQVVAGNGNPEVIERVLAHMERQGATADVSRLAETRTPTSGRSGSCPASWRSYYLFALDLELAPRRDGAKRTGDPCLVTDILTIARSLHPGQNKSLNALYKRYNAANAQYASTRSVAA